MKRFAYELKTVEKEHAGRPAWYVYGVGIDGSKELRAVFMSNLEAQVYVNMTYDLMFQDVSAVTLESLDGLYVVSVCYKGQWETAGSSPVRCVAQTMLDELKDLGIEAARR